MSERMKRYWAEMPPEERERRKAAFAAIGWKTLRRRYPMRYPQPVVRDTGMDTRTVDKSDE